MFLLKIDKQILFGTDYMRTGLALLILPPKLIQNRYAKLAYPNDLTIFRLQTLYTTFILLQWYYCCFLYSINCFDLQCTTHSTEHIITIEMRRKKKKEMLGKWEKNFICYNCKKKSNIINLIMYFM